MAERISQTGQSTGQISLTSLTNLIDQSGQFDQEYRVKCALNGILLE